MKVNKQKIEPDPNFEPFTLNIEIESEEEARALYAIFNNKDNIRLLPFGASTAIKSSIGREHYCQTGEQIARGITYEQYYRKS